MVFGRRVMTCLAVLLGACASAPPTSSVVVHERDTSDASAPLTPVASASSSAATAPATSVGVPPPSFLPRVSNPGKIYCGTTECDAKSEICCFDGSSGRCEDKANSCDTAEENQRACDEAEDCPKGLLCCASSTGSMSRDAFQCEDRSKAWRGLCAGGSEAPVLGGEVCMPGSSCKGSRTCVIDASRPGDTGYCSLPAPSVRCVKETCSGDTPVCGFLVEDGKLHGGCEESKTSGGMTCASPADCAGYPCLQFSEGDDAYFRCGDLFTTWGNARGALCKAIRDCPSMQYGRTDIKLRPLGCRKDPHLPGGAKRCIYPPEPK